MLEEDFIETESGSHEPWILGSLAAVRKAALVALATSLATLALYALSRPALPNGDGVGYLRALRFSQLAPGHPAYVPLLRLLGEPAAEHARWLSVACGALGVLLLAARGGALAAAATALSWGYWSSAADVEVYAPATLCVIVVLVVKNPFVRALAAGAAIALHLENVLLLPFVLLEAGPIAAVGAALAGEAAYVGAAFFVLHLPARAALSWILSSRHGFAEPLWQAPAGALFGCARSIAAAPYFYEAPVSRVVAQLAVGAVIVLLVVGTAFRDPAPLGLQRRSVLALVIPYALVGLLFFPTDSERWLVLLPLFWLWAAPALERVPALAAAGLLALAAFNLAFGVIPQRDPGPAEAMRAARAVIAPGDLVIAPGHGWDEYLDFDGSLPAGSRLILLSYYAGRDGPEVALEGLRAAAGPARRVLLVRLLEDADPRGWKELSRLGITRERVRGALGGGALRRLAPDVYLVERSPARFGRQP